ncbi:MAG: serine hydrolase [Xanthobacteraceae bacterium]
MSRIRIEAPPGLRAAVPGLAALATVLVLGSGAASGAPYADIVVDANSGTVLHATNPDALRHPASLTKIMTLYLLFEQLEAGKLKLDSPLKVSEAAASQSPTKLGLRSGSTIAVEDAIKGIVTRSANDAAVVIGEAVAGDEAEFAKLMTQKAHALGMSRTTYKNASGLPDDDQVTTARDQALLGRTIQERFPRYYRYFSTRSFSYHGQWIGNHNRLLGRVEGVDGIKTGYTRASGFNLVTSVHRGNRYVVAVVLGGANASSRDARMRELINQKIALASSSRTATSETASSRREAPALEEPKLTAATDEKAEVKGTKQRTQKAAFALASAASTPAQVESAAASPRASGKTDSGTPSWRPARISSAETTAKAPPALPAVVTADVEQLPSTALALAPPPSAEPIRPVLVRTVTVRVGHAAAQAQAVAPRSTEPAKAPQPAAVANVPVSAPSPAATFAPSRASTPERVAAAVLAAPLPAPAKIAEGPSALAFAPMKDAATFATPAPPPAASRGVTARTPAARAPGRSGWVIQVGAFPAEQEAKQRLSTVQSKASKVLSGADPFTESVDKGGTTLYRARFAGLDKDKAEAACKFLKRDGVDCVTIKN